jgi:membrane protein DedA with SNARE-associated domain
MLLSALSSYGVATLFVSILVSAFGLPLPTSFLLIVAGSFVATGDLAIAPVLAASIAGAVIGDHLGYLVGRSGGRSFAERAAARLGATQTLMRAEATANKWGALTVFLSRWLITAIGPYVNLVSGVTGQRLPVFAFWVVLGETLWVLAYVYTGVLFGDKISEISDALGDFTGVIAAAAIAGVLLLLLIRNRRAEKEEQRQKHKDEIHKNTTAVF